MKQLEPYWVKKPRYTQWQWWKITTYYRDKDREQARLEWLANRTAEDINAYIATKRVQDYENPLPKSDPTLPDHECRRGVDQLCPTCEPF